MSSHDALVVGGGIGGLAAALALARAGRRILVAEQASRFAEIGAGLQLGPNAMRAFDRLGVLGPVLDSAVLPDRAVVRDAVTGEELTVLDLGPPFRARYGYPYVVAHRHDVLSVLIDACRSEAGIELRTGRTAVDVREREGHAEVTFADGEVLTARLLVGADGIRSRARHLIDAGPPRFSGHVAYRGASVRSQLGPELAADDVTLWIGPGIHLMQYPVRRGELYNQVAVYERPAGAREPRGEVEELRAAFSVAHPRVREYVALLDPHRDWPVYDREPLPTWTTAHTALLGDAAHAMLQYLGQGACQALEDAVALGDAVSDHPHGQDRALKQYEERRIARASRCQTVARPWGDLWHTQDPTLLALRNRVFRLRRPDDYSELDWLYATPTEDAA
ncbi:FAD-dependent monooxygenase [Streptomyces fuscichromogenes]|uniref:Salicylate hydroxylase n=1 Tax=Streptomyces fuscichromogenes TaxID=1324013 RepID=A0A918CTP6_9ACTN|nr:FAD-dependent monooxygenase [Streptomyces fuscichromogenes]GGN22622.1 salicylate hydroxylase [Streptomyces fuscichromogenes]